MNAQPAHKPATVIPMRIVGATAFSLGKAVHRKVSHGKAQYDRGYNDGFVYGALITGSVYSVAVLLAYILLAL